MRCGKRALQHSLCSARSKGNRPEYSCCSRGSRRRFICSALTLMHGAKFCYGRGSCCFHQILSACDGIRNDCRSLRDHAGSRASLCLFRLRMHDHLGEWIKGMKRQLSSALSDSSVRPTRIPGQILSSLWQPGFHDHLLRSK
jgi:hypothetical protein